MTISKKTGIYSIAAFLSILVLSLLSAPLFYMEKPKAQKVTYSIGHGKTETQPIQKNLKSQAVTQKKKTQKPVLEVKETTPILNSKKQNSKYLALKSAYFTQENFAALAGAWEGETNLIDERSQSSLLFLFNIKENGTGIKTVKSSGLSCSTQVKLHYTLDQRLIIRDLTDAKCNQGQYFEAQSIVCQIDKQNYTICNGHGRTQKQYKISLKFINKEE